MTTPRMFAALAIALLFFAAAPAPQTVVIATAEGRTAGAAASELRGFLAHLNSQKDIRYTVQTYPSYDLAYDAFRNRKADLMLVGSVKYVQAHHEIGAIPVVVEEPKWQESALVVPAGSPIKTVDQLKGKNVAFGYEGSTTTDLLPRLLLSKHHMTVADLKKVEYSGPQQELIVKAVTSGAVDAGALTTTVFNLHKDTLRALDVSERVPGGTVVAHKDINPATLQKIRGGMISYKPAEGAARERFGHGASVAEDADYNKVRFLCKVLFGKTYH